MSIYAYFSLSCSTNPAKLQIIDSTAFFMFYVVYNVIQKIRMVEFYWFC